VIKAVAEIIPTKRFLVTAHHSLGVDASWLEECDPTRRQQ
jgi:hypothetical protein